MLNKFIGAEELKKKYFVCGSFYNLKLDENNPLPCRNDLQILDKEFYSKCINIANHEPDALVIMMNPGSSSPKDKNYEIPPFNKLNLSRNLLKNLRVPTKPDNAQYQVMRVALKRRWKYIRVINLSDIREPKSNQFGQILKNLKNITNGKLPSIFCKDRVEEINKIFNSLDANTPVILAWGTKSFLEDYAKMCLKCLPSNRKVIGIPYKKSDYLYYHASPPIQKFKEEWLSNIIKMLK